MKNTTLTVTFNTEKLDALTFHMEKTIRFSGFMKNMCRRQPVNISTTRSPVMLRERIAPAVRYALQPADRRRKA